MDAATFFRLVALAFMTITGRTYWREYGKAHYQRFTQAQNLVDSLETSHLQQAPAQDLPSTVQRPGDVPLPLCPMRFLSACALYRMRPEDHCKT